MNGTIHISVALNNLNILNPHQPFETPQSSN